MLLLTFFDENKVILVVFLCFIRHNSNLPIMNFFCSRTVHQI